MFVLPLYEVLLVPGVNMYVRGEEFEEFALSKAVLHEDVVLLTVKDRKSTRLNSSHPSISRMPSSA